MTTRRRIVGFPGHPTTGQPATAAELARARQTGQTVQKLRQEQSREDAAAELEALLERDKSPSDTMHGILATRTRWALHLAIGVLRGQRQDKDDES